MKSDAGVWTTTTWTRVCWLQDLTTVKVKMMLTPVLQNCLLCVCVCGGGWRKGEGGEICLLVGCLMSQQHASVSLGLICSDNFSCCHTEIEVADQTFYLTQSEYTDSRPTGPSADPVTPGAWQGRHWSANFFVVTGMTWPEKIPAQVGFEPRVFCCPLSRRTP